MASSVVPIGRRMAGREKFIAPALYRSSRREHDICKSSFRDARATRGPGIQPDSPCALLDSGFAGFRPRPGMTPVVLQRAGAG
jgi:hypothetical protein